MKFKYLRGETDIKQDEFNHQHICEIKMLSNKYPKCPYGVKRNRMSYDDKCDYCSHLRIVNLNKKGNVITSIDKIER